MAKGSWNPYVIKPRPRCRLCGKVVKRKDFVRLNGINPAHKECADMAGRVYTNGKGFVMQVESCPRHHKNQKYAKLKEMTE